ncbi:MAG: NAD(P)H-quinone oxidoreductase chain 4 1 [Planctomycetes bacterium]|nr:NAD(P)H-quinone oxidoreductase chain 4 1 [Planctomycetota bacterium]
MDSSLLELLILVPAVATALMFFVPAKSRALVVGLPAVAGAACLALSLRLFWIASTGGEAALAKLAPPVTAIVPSFGVHWALGADGMSAVMCVLTSIVMLAGSLVSIRSERTHTGIGDRPKVFFLLFLGLVTGVFGVFLFRDLFLFYFSYELAVVPMYMLIGMWGSTQATANKDYAAMKLTLYLTAGALVALVGLLALYYQAWQINGKPSFLLSDILAARARFDAGFQIWTYAFLFIGFAAIIPMWPLHTWSPIGHAAAPAAGSMMHAGVLMKLGAFAVLRIAYPTCPEGAAHWMPYVALLAMMNIVYGGLVAMAQQDMKFVIGFSSSSHMGYTLLGLASVEVIGCSGSVFLMFAHGVMTALAFSLIGFFYDQTHNRWIPDLGGLAHQLPFVGTCFVFMAMASAGVPGFANFASEFMVMVGAWKAGFVWQAVVSVFGVVIGAVYLLRAVRDAFFGPRNPRWNKLHDAHGLQRVPFLFMLAVLLATGFYPRPVTDVIDAAVRPIVQDVQRTKTYREKYPDRIELAEAQR